MAGWREITTLIPLDLSDGSGAYRYIVDGSADLSLRKALTVLGFDGTEGVDWEEVETYSAVSAITWRFSVRFDAWNIDYSITPTGFAGVETTDWLNYETYNLP